jgi:hypothetical protein
VIGLDPRMSSIRIDHPNLSVAVVVEKRLQILARTIPCPDDFRAIDVRGVIHPLVVHVMAWSIANYNQILLGRGLQLPSDLRAR